VASSNRSLEDNVADKAGMWQVVTLAFEGTVASSNRSLEDNVADNKAGMWQVVTLALKVMWQVVT
jgi:hypothetical protein